MTRKEFREIIKNTKKDLLKSFDDGVCEALYNNSDSTELRDDFNWICGPFRRGRVSIGLDGRYSYWLGKLNERRLPRRIDTLLFFEQFMLSTEEYKYY